MSLTIEKKGEKKSPHLALCHESQGFSANKRPVSLLMKAGVSITEEMAQLIEKVTGVAVEATTVAENATDIEKASYANTRRLLGEAIKKFDLESDNEDYYSWSYVEDFDEQYVVFCNNQGLFYTTYEINTEGVVVGETATSVTQVVSFREDGGTLILSQDNSTNASVQSLIVKSFDSIKSNEKLVEVIKSIQEKGKLMEVEIQKAVDSATAELKVTLEKASADLLKANEKIAEMEKAAQEVKQAVRSEKIATVVGDADKAAELLKATAVLDDEAFEVILKSFQAKTEQLETSELFTRQSSQEDIEKADGEPMHVQLLKKQYKLS